MRITTIPGIFQWALLALLFAGCGAQEQDSNAQSTDGGTEFVVQSAETVAAAEPNLDLHPGKLLHDTNCISCHDTGSYTRAARKVSDFPKLLAQVQRCDATLGPRLSDDEIGKVADYLNQAFYRYQKH